jgi:DNA repair photolyase
LREILVKSVLNKKKKRDEWFLDDYTLNPYEGCSFNCQYCYVRGSKYGENMEETLAAKINGPEVLDRQLELRARKNQHGIIVLASATDPYIKAEERYRLTQAFLRIIHDHRFPVLVLTKSKLILRDIELLQLISQTATHAPELSGKLPGAVISFSFSTLDDHMAASLEPGAPLPSERIETLIQLKRLGFKVGVNLMPLLPWITDQPSEIERMVNIFSKAGADFVLAGGLTLFGNGQADSRTLFLKFIERKHPELLVKYQEMYAGPFPPYGYARNFYQVFDAICHRYQMPTRMATA